jgi:dimethylaniline monooxygenase (N-oxide forming)
MTDSGDLLSAITLQKIKRVAAIDRVRGSDVYFVDGSKRAFDIIIFGTGFKQKYDFMPDALKPTTHGLYEDCLLPHEPAVAYILFVLPFGSHWQVAEGQAMFVALVHDGVIPLPSRETMCTLASPCSGTHEHFAEYFRVKYLALLAKYVFPPPGEPRTLRSLIRHPLVLWRVLWSPYIAPMGEWASASQYNRTHSSDVIGHMSTKWRGFRVNHR